MCLSTGAVVKTAAHDHFEITGRESVRHGLVDYKTSVVRGNQTVSVTNTIQRAINFTILVRCFFVCMDHTVGIVTSCSVSKGALLRI